MDRPLPNPERTRWQPLRSGLINLFKYDNETFYFKNGRLLLRGNNGAGKSRVLALQLPFLLDGEITSSRVEPDASPDKRMEWHLLMDNKFSHRVGYTWVEFGRLTSAGQTEFCTLGCGMEMSKGGNFNRWFFITPLRVGASLQLVREGRYPLTKELLESSLTSGTVYHKAVREYRRAVNDRLFQLEEERYDALVNLLIQLRKPQLSKDLDEKLLSKALSDSLPPLDPATLNDVAEAFRELEHDRTELQNYERSSAALKQFNESYQRYARVAVGRNANKLRDAHNAYEREQRNWKHCNDALGLALTKALEAEEAVGETKREKEENEGAANVLRDSPEMKTANDLKLLEESARRAGITADRAQADFVKAQLLNASRQSELNNALGAMQDDQDRANESAAALRLAEAPLGMQTPIDDAERSPAKIESIKRKAAVEVQRLREQQRHLQSLSGKVVEAANRLRTAEELRNNQEGRLNKARETEADRRSQHKRATSDLISAVRQWFTRAALLLIADAEERIEALLRWCETIDGVNPVAAAVSDARTLIENELSQRMGELRGMRDALAVERRVFEVEQTKLRAGIETVPPAACGINVARRLEIDGAPLWKLCDFQDGVSAADRAGCEAALQASGLLDAWITPRGELLGKDNNVLLDCAQRSAPVQRNLSALLKFTPNAQDSRAALIEPATVERILCAIGTEPEGEIFSTVGGEWHNGILAGRWSKPAAEFIGAGAREAARKKRLEEIDGELKRLHSEDQALLNESATLEARRAQAREEERSLPGDYTVRDAMTQWTQANVGVERELREHERLCDAASAQKRACDTARETLATTARELKLEIWIEKLAELREAIDAIERRMRDLWHALETLHRVQLNVERSRNDLKEAIEHVAEFKRRSEDAGNLRARLQKEYETLEQFAGPKAREALDRLKAVMATLHALAETLKKREEHWREAQVAHARTQQKLEGLDEKVKIAEEERTRHIEAFRIFASTGMLEQLSESAEGIEAWSPTRLVDYVREVHARIGAPALSDEAWDGTQNELHRDFQKLQTDLSAQNLRPESETRHGVDVISIEYDGKLRRVLELLERLNKEVEHRRQLLNAEERKFIENHLIGEVADHLHTLICGAAVLVSDMTAEAAKRPTSAAGMTLRFKWEPLEDGPAGTTAVCTLLKRARSTWTEPERETLAAFLQARIQDVRTTAEFETWREVLERAVDYRAWHAFFVEQKMGGDWKRMTKRTHGTGSSGEKAVALTIPQFAAAAAHYHSKPDAPRLILLDEAFVGIDPLMRANCMGLLEAFDLDFVMTSENEWGCYPTISGLSICQLATRAGINAIAVTPWIWNGKVKTRVDTPVAMLPLEGAQS